MKQMDRMRHDYYKRRVFGMLNEGDTFIVIGDFYNSQNHGAGTASKRKVIRFYRNYVLSEDMHGLKETFQYFDLFMILQNGGTIKTSNE